MIVDKDFFKEKAGAYEQDSKRVKNVKNIAEVITKEIEFDKSMSIMDFGSGTGLLLEQIAPLVKHITAVDMSTAMNNKLRSKRDDLPCELDIKETDLTKSKLDQRFDSIISSMTMHHIEDIRSMLSDFYNMLEPDGTIAIADLDTEDGTFHTEDTGVHHQGFDREYIKNLAMDVGFRDVKIQDASVAQKPYGDFPIFLLTGKK